MTWPELVQRINPHLYRLDSSPSTSSASFFTEFDNAPAKQSRNRGAVRPESPPRPKKSGDSVLLQNVNTSQSQSAPFIPPTKHNQRINDALDLMSRCLHWDHTRRITAAEALQHPFLFEEEDADGDPEGDFEDEWEGYDLT